MRNLSLIALALLFSFPASSFAFDNYKVLGNYKELSCGVEKIDENSVGVTEKDLERTLKLRLLKNGIKPITDYDYDDKHYMYLNVNIIDVIGGFAAKVVIELNKYSDDYVSPDHGASDHHIPYEFVSGGFGSMISGATKSDLLENVESCLDDFILAYLEANME